MKKIIILLIILSVGGIFVFKNNSLFFFNNSSQPSLTTREGVETNTYQNQNYGFSLTLLEGVEVKNVEDAGSGGETILVSKSDFDTYQMQIYVMPFEEDIVLTAERIKKDIPDLKMKNEREIKIGEISGVEFLDEEQNTKEVWFVKGGVLYQVSSFLKDEKMLAEILDVWRWQ